MNNLATTIPIITAIAAAIWGIYVFNKQQRFKRLQNLSTIFQRFTDNDSFLELFTSFDIAFPEYGSLQLEKIEDVSEKSKLQFLALLEEVALYASYSEVDRKYAIHLFQWHFYYIYNDPKISEAFWSKLGGVSETSKPYWEYQKKFSVFCKPLDEPFRK